MARILVIDDDETFSYVLKRACSRQGHEVMLSASACEAKEASAGMFDIVFFGHQPAGRQRLVPPSPAPRQRRAP